MSIRLRLISAFTLSIAAIIALSIVNQITLNQIFEARRWVEHTYEVIERLETIVSLCKDLEAGQRGYSLTREEVFLEPYDKAVGRIANVVSRVRELTLDNPVQQRRVDRLEELTSAKTATIRRYVDQTRNIPKTSQFDFARGADDKALMDNIRVLISEMETDEKSLLAKRVSEADRLSNMATMISLLGAGVVILFTGGAAMAVITSFSRSVGNLQEGLDKIGEGDLNVRVDSNSKDEFARVGLAFNDMAGKLAQSTQESVDQSWLNAGLAGVAQTLQGERDLQSAAQKILKQFSALLGSKHGMFYIAKNIDSQPELSLLASFAHNERKHLSNNIEMGQGLVGQCALEKERILATNLPDDFIKISSGSGEAAPKNVVVVPILYEGKVKAVIEQASFEPFTPIQLQFLDSIAVNLGVILAGIESTETTERLLRQEQTLSEELQSQQEELMENNAKLEGLASSLQSSEEELRQQQEELQQTNEELEERSRIQIKQNAELEVKNLELEQLKQSMQEKANQLSLTSKYKSEFLSNMSHELRTPLNSLLILSKVLTENSEGNLTEKQIEFAKTIYSAGSDLLVLIDDVLDISKIEAGAMSIDIADEAVKNICYDLIPSFDELAKQKGIELNVDISPQVPRFVKTDSRRLQQVLKNIISNALKFTMKGSITLKVDVSTEGWDRDNQVLNNADSVIAFHVIDTGIGIPEDKQRIIFEAFQQADGTTNRKFGGTGLGLAISREITRLLGGEIKLKSEVDKGSTFTILLPQEYAGARDKPMAPKEKSNGKPALSQIDFQPAKQFLTASKPSDADQSVSGAHSTVTFSNVKDDRSEIEEGDKILLVVHQEDKLTEQLMELAHNLDFKVLTANQGKSAFALVQKFKPDAIVLDVGLPDKDGWIFLDRVKRDSATRHIPVYVISDEDRQHQARRLGAVGYAHTPANRQGVVEIVNSLQSFVARGVRNLLIVEDNDTERKNLENLIEGQDVRITAVSNGKEAFEALTMQHFDCMVLDLGLPDMSGFDLLHKVQSDEKLADLPVVVHTGRTLSSNEESELKRFTDAIVVKGAKSLDRLLDETTLFLHRVESNLPEQKRQVLERLHLKDPLLYGRKILIVDDDMRHIFAITSMLEQYDMRVIYAENGQQSIDILQKTPGVELVLMDVMMPGMDGYEAMKTIRKLDKCQDLPIIALTAKAMKGDREQCIAAGASDYLSKPVDIDQLLSLMRVWLY